MRTIKFRGKRCDNSEWVCGYYVGCTETWKGGHFHKSWIITSARSNGGFFALQGRYPVQDQTIGQFTGMHDKNGKEIYEGDIIKYTRYNFKSEYLKEEKIEEIYVVFWNESKHAFYCHTEFENGGGSSGFLVFEDERAEKNEIEIVGNIHDNPELLRGGEKK